MLERKNPLPVGRYWVDVPEDDLQAFQLWLSARPTQVHVNGTAERTSNGGPFGIFEGWGPKTYWYDFQVISPVPWFGPGTPTIADASITSVDDTVQRPPPEPGFLDQLMGAAGSVPTLAKYVVWGGGAVVGSVLLWKLFQVVDLKPPRG